MTCLENSVSENKIISTCSQPVCFQALKMCYFAFCNWKARWKKGVRDFRLNLTLPKQLQISHACLFTRVKTVFYTYLT